MRPEQNRGYILVLTAGVLWGTIGFFATLLSGLGMNAGPVAFFRGMSASFILALLMLIRGKGLSLFHISRKGIFSCMLVGAVSQAAYNFCYMNAIEQTGMATAAVLLYTSPIYVALISRIFFREPLTGNKIAAIAMNFTGCVLTVTGGRFSDLRISGFGLLMGALAGFCYALLPILSRTGADRENPFTAAFYQQAFGMLFLLFLIRPYQNVGTTFSWEILLILLGFGLIPSSLGYLAYCAGISRIRETSRIPVLASVETAVAAVIGLLVFGQELSFVMVIGIVLVLCSVAMMNAR